MKTNASKIFFAITGLLILGVLVFFYVGFNGNPIRVYLTRGQIARYLKTTYPDIEFSNISSHYNFKNSSYGGRATAHTDPEVDIYINQYRTGIFSDNLLEAKLTAQAKAEIIPLAMTLFPGKEYMLMLSWDESNVQLPINTQFSRDLPVELFLDVRWKGSTTNDDEFVDEVLEIHEKLSAEGYTFTGYTFIKEITADTDLETIMVTLKGSSFTVTRDGIKEQLYKFNKSK